MKVLPLNSIVEGDCLAVMREWPEECIDFVMFSPPYWGLRNYGESTETVWGGKAKCEHKWIDKTKVQSDAAIKRGPNSILGPIIDKDREPQVFSSAFCAKCGAWKGQLGLEPTWQLYISHMVTVCQKLKRVLKKTGSMYIVLGDTYYTGKGTCFNPGGGESSLQSYRKKPEAVQPPSSPNRLSQGGYQPKCLMGVPWRVAFALIDDGWVLRERIVWHKGNAMPGSQKDRLTQTCELIFHFVKNTGKALLWRNELTGEWLSQKPKQVYFHVETHELRDECPPKEERYAVDEFGSRHLIWKPLWRGFDYYYELDAIRIPWTDERKSDIQRALNKHPGYKGKYAKGYNFEYRKILPGQGIKGQPVGDPRKGKNPGDVIKWANVPGQAQQGNFGHGGTHGNRFNHPDGKNPGDIISERVKANLEHFIPKGSGGHYAYGGLDSEEGKHYAEKGKNPGDFWTICTKPFKGAHFAVYPEAICVNPILSSSPPNGIVLDPMCGSGTTCLVAKKLGRNYIGIEINSAYVEMARKRLLAVPERLDTFMKDNKK